MVALTPLTAAMARRPRLPGVSSSLGLSIPVRAYESPWEELATAYEILPALDQPTRLRWLFRAAAVWESGATDVSRAFDVLARALEASPADAEVRARLHRLAGLRGLPWLRLGAGLSLPLRIGLTRRRRLALGSRLGQRVRGHVTGHLLEVLVVLRGGGLQEHRLGRIDVGTGGSRSHRAHQGSRRHQAEAGDHPGNFPHARPPVGKRGGIDCARGGSA
jgi:hypothetical protein